jgi:hypothetical protein
MSCDKCTPACCFGLEFLLTLVVCHLGFVGLCCVLCVVLFVCREAAIAAISQKVHLGVREERRTHLQRTSFWIPEVAPSAGPSAIPKVSVCVCVCVCVCFAFYALCM